MLEVLQIEGHKEALSEFMQTYQAGLQSENSDFPTENRIMLYCEYNCPAHIIVHKGVMHMIETLGSRLRQLRDDKHLQQEQVANLIGVNKSTISLYENDMRQPSYETLVRLATLYRVSTDYLLGCASARMIDVSGLTADEVAAINQIVTMMTAKNQYIEENGP